MQWKVGETINSVVAPENATNVTYAWSTSDSADGEFTTIEGQTGASLAVTADMVGKFIKLNVTGDEESKAEAATTEAVSIKVEEMTAAQTGAKTIEVLLPEAPAGDETYTVIRNNTEQTIASTAVDGNKVTLTLDTAIKAVEYTVSSSNEALSDAVFTGEEAKLVEIKIGENLIANGQDASKNYIYKAAYETLDQRGGEYNVASFDSAVCSAGTVTPSKGILTVERKAVLHSEAKNISAPIPSDHITHFGVTGAPRRRLVKKLSSLTGNKISYLGFPSCAFTVGKLVITRDGTVEGVLSGKVLKGLEKAGFSPVNP